MLRNAARKTPRVLIVDDDPLFAETLELLLVAAGGVNVVGRAGDGAEAVELALRLRPDVVVMDVQMPVLDGIAATRRIRELLAEARVVLVTGATDAGVVSRARLAGATACLRKGCSVEEVLDAARGGAGIGTSVAVRAGLSAA